MSAVDKPLKTATRGNGKHRRRRWLPYLGGLSLIVLIVAGFWPKPVPVETAEVSIGSLRATVNEEGKTRIRQKYVVSSPISGQLRRIAFKAGAEVTAQQTVLAIIDPVLPGLLDSRTRASAEARRDSALANLERAKISHHFAASELSRFEKLFETKTISVQEREAAQMRESSAAKDQAAAESALRQAEAELQEIATSGQPSTNSICTITEIKAPATGKVLRVFEENSRVLTAGTPLLEIGDPADLEVVIEVLSRDGAIIPTEAKVEFEQWGGGVPMTGRVRVVEPAAFTKVSALGVEEQRVNVVADLLTPQEQRRNVGDNFRVEAKIIVWEAPDALKVPAGALFRQEEKWATFVIVNGRAQLRQVKAGRSSGTEIQVLEGLQRGEQLILYPGSRVHAGQRVRPIKI
jgi:HlyD family secretion protein